MSPIPTRRSARLHGPATQPRSRTDTKTRDDLYNLPSSSDEDDDKDDDNEFIPANISPHRVVASANGPTLSRPRPPKRPLEDASLRHEARFKKHRSKEVNWNALNNRPQLPARKELGLASPPSSRAVTTMNDRASRSISRESSSDHYVDPELFKLVNSKMLKRKPDEAPPSPSQQILQEIAGRERSEQEIPEQVHPEPGETEPEEIEREESEPELEQGEEMAVDDAPISDEDEEDNAYSNIELDGDIDLSSDAIPGIAGGAVEGLDEDESDQDVLGLDSDHSVPQTEPMSDAEGHGPPDESASSAPQVADNAMIMPIAQHGSSDPWEVPESPDRADHDEDAANAEQSHANILQAQLVDEASRARSQESEQADAEDTDIDSEVDFEVESNLDLDCSNLSLHDCLTQDVERFRSREGDFEDSLLFGPPDSPSSTTIDLSSRNVEDLRKIIKRKGWVGLGRARDAEGRPLDWESKLNDDWERKLQDDSEPVTAVGKVLFHYAEKLGRLIWMAFTAQSQETRNRVFRNHIDFLQYCFSMLENCIAFIHDQRLSFLKIQTPLSQNEEKRREMVEEIAALHIPTIVRLLIKIWDPCSKNDHCGSFDSFAIQLLARVAGWIEHLYGPFIREVREAGGSASWFKIREAFETPMKQLRTQLARAPELLEQEEIQEVQRQKQLQQQLEAQKEEELRAQQEEEERIEARRRQNQEVAQFIRAGTDRRFAARRRQNQDVLLHQGPPRRKRDASQQLQSPPAATGVAETKWLGEEEHVLCDKLISSFAFKKPRLPDLKDTATKVGHSQAATVDKARELLPVILSHGGMGSLSEEDIHNMVQTIMRQWE
ncbi:hypothetical protein PG985_003165 [Apiospora marii]|uniref:uncharacterized protein n=1 Tax=Apiospora marii TaxID=335849 RepID=UPI0031319E5F